MVEARLCRQVSLLVFAMIFPAAALSAETEKAAPANLAQLSLDGLFKRLDAAPAPWCLSGRVLAEPVGDAPDETEENHFDAILSEIIRRGGADAQRLLEGWLEKQSGLATATRKYQSLPISVDETIEFDQTQEGYIAPEIEKLEPLTALRRIQKLPDALAVEVWVVVNAEGIRRRDAFNDWLLVPVDRESKANHRLRIALIHLGQFRERLAALEPGSNEWEEQNQHIQQQESTIEECRAEIAKIHEKAKQDRLFGWAPVPPVLSATTRELPSFTVLLRSVDVSKQPVRIKERGDYRSGRQARWRFEVKDSDGRILPVRPSESRWRGGVICFGDLKHGDYWQTTMPMSSFIDIPKPGEYTVTVLYHNAVTIADVIDPHDLNDLIVFRSKPFKLKVEKAAPRVIGVNADSRKSAAALIRQLPKQGSVKVVCHDYDQSQHNFVAPESPPGKLLQMGWQAVPELLDAINENEVDRRQKAWCLSILYTIARERDLSPVKHEKAFPYFEWRTTATSNCGGSGGLSRYPRA